MSKIRIDKNVPMPVRYPFADMQVGDSFAVPKTVHRTTVSIAALRYGRKHGMKFAVRQTDPINKSLRCWRVA